MKLGPEEREVVRQVMQRANECSYGDGGKDDLEWPGYEGLNRLGVSGGKLRKAVEQRLAMGQEQYGKLDLARDDRDFFLESIAEKLDDVIYLACEVVRARKQAAVPVKRTRK